jgi:hypothetical protein
VIRLEIDMGNWLTKLRGWSLAARETVLVAATALVGLVFLPLAIGQYGSAGPLAVATAATVCALSSGLALWASDVNRAPHRLLQGMLYALMLRTGIPMSFAMVVQLAAGLLTWAGLGYWLLLFYLVALGAEVLLSLPHNGLAPQHPAGNGVN